MHTSLNTQYTLRALAPLLLATLLAGVALAKEPVAAKPSAQKVAAAAKAPSAKHNVKDVPVEAKALSGISILGNQDAPKALVIVPWKSSQLGESQEISKTLDDSRQPVDKEVFMRELSYYEIRSAGGK